MKSCFIILNWILTWLLLKFMWYNYRKKGRKMRKISFQKFFVLLSALLCSFAGVIFLNGVYITYVLLLPATDQNSLASEAKTILAVPDTTLIVLYFYMCNFFVSSGMWAFMQHWRPKEESKYALELSVIGTATCNIRNY